MWLNLILNVLAQMPPTPTYLPEGTPPGNLTLPEQHLWDYAPITIQMWNTFRDETPYLQIALVLLMLFTLVMFIMRKLSEFGDEK